MTPLPHAVTTEAWGGGDTSYTPSAVTVDVPLEWATEVTMSGLADGGTDEPEVMGLAAGGAIVDIPAAAARPEEVEVGSAGDGDTTGHRQPSPLPTYAASQAAAAPELAEPTKLAKERARAIATAAAATTMALGKQDNTVAYKGFAIGLEVAGTDRSDAAAFVHSELVPPLEGGLERAWDSVEQDYFQVCLETPRAGYTWHIAEHSAQQVVEVLDTNRGVLHTHRLHRARIDYPHWLF